MSEGYQRPASEVVRKVEGKREMRESEVRRLREYIQAAPCFGHQWFAAAIRQRYPGRVVIGCSHEAALKATIWKKGQEWCRSATRERREAEEQEGGLSALIMDGGELRVRGGGQGSVQ